MRHRLSGRKLGRPTAHRMLMLRTMATDLLRHESIHTTEARARELRSITEKLITQGRRGSLHDRRRALAFLTDSKVGIKLFDDIGPRFKERPGGYTRIVKTGQRKGDASSMAVIELVA